ncbi:MAG: ferritin-like fold-containing protein, partial [Angustibacter sp.]
MPHNSLDPRSNPDYRLAVIDILGALAYAELTAFSRLAADAELAPSLAERAALGRASAGEFQHFELLGGRLAQLGADTNQALLPFVPAIDRFHDRTRPSSWLEGLVKAFVGGGIAADFYREIAAYLDDETAALV